MLAEDWLADGYRFRQNGTSMIPRKHPVVKKVHYQLHVPDGRKVNFRKYTYEVLSEPDFFVVQYEGDESLAVDFPHG